MNQELMRIIDSICRDKNIEREALITDIETAIAGALRKHFEETADAQVRLDPITGEFSATVDGNPVDFRLLGRIAAQAAKQTIIQRTRDRERTSIFDEFTGRRGSIVTGTVIRAEGGNLLVNIGRTEGFLPRSEQIPGETHAAGERLRALILEVRDQPNQIKVILSRSHPEFIERLFELEVPEVAEHVIEIKTLAREAGYRTKVAVSSIDSKVDAVGACVGVRGSRIKNIVDELGGEKIDIVRWNESSQILIQNALKPAEVQEIALCFELGKATVVVAEDQLSLAIGKRGQNVRLAARLTNWDIDILTPVEYNKHLELLENTLKRVPGVDDVMVDKVIAFGCVSVTDIDEIGAEPLVKELDFDPELAAKIVEECGEEAIHLEEQREAEAKAKAEAARLGLTAPAAPAAAATESGESAPAADAQTPGSGLLLADESGPLSPDIPKSLPPRDEPLPGVELAPAGLESSPEGPPHVAAVASAAEVKIGGDAPADEPADELADEELASESDFEQTPRLADDQPS